MKKTFYYSVKDCGDGSAYPIFFEDEACANIHQELGEIDDGGWGESCVSSITVEVSVDCDVKLIEAKSKEKFISELEDDLEFAIKYNKVLKCNTIKKALEKLKE